MQAYGEKLFIFEGDAMAERGIRGVLVNGALLCALFVSLAPSALACSCLQTGAPCQEFWRAGAVFAGLVEEISDTPARESEERHLGTMRGALFSCPSQRPRTRANSERQQSADARWHNRSSSGTGG